jgi:hypothetical protein
MPNEFKVKNGLLVSGSTNISTSGSTIFSVDGASGRLLQIDDSVSGSLFSVNTSAGLPIIEAFSDNTVRIGQSGQRALFVSQSKVGINKESVLNGLLDVSGSVTVTGSVAATSFTGSLLGTASTASFVTTAQTASFVTTAQTASYVLQAVSASFITTAQTASYILQAVSASFATSASFAISASWAPSAGGGSSNITIGDESVTQGTATYLNFLGAGVTAAVASNTASITISGGGGGGTPGGANTTIQFNDSSAFSGSGNFTFTKATNTVRIQASGSALLVISGSQGELLRVQDSGSSPGTLATISSGSLNILTVTTSSVVITGSLNISGSLNAPRITAASSLFLFFNY